MEKFLLLRFITGAVAKEVVWLKTGALLPGHQPSIKDGDPLKLKREKKKKKKRKRKKERKKRKQPTLKGSIWLINNSANFVVFFFLTSKQPTRYLCDLEKAAHYNSYLTKKQPARCLTDYKKQPSWGPFDLITAHNRLQIHDTQALKC